MEKHWFLSHKPKRLQDLNHSAQVTLLLYSLASLSNIQNLMIHGGPGSGKYTRALCLLRQIFGDDVYNIQYHQNEIVTSDTGDQKVFNYVIGSSKYHYQLDGQTLGKNAKVVIQSVIKQIAEEPVETLINGKSMPKIILIKQGCFLQKIAQAALRATMQKYVSNCRIFLLCRDSHRIIYPIRSRCLKIRLITPSITSISGILQNISESTKSKIDENIIQMIAQHCQGNIRKAINYLQSYYFHSQNSDYADLPNQWIRQQVSQIVRMMIKDQSLDQQLRIRQKVLKGGILSNPLQELMAILIEQIIKYDLGNQLLLKVIGKSAQYETLFDRKLVQDERASSVMAFLDQCLILLKKQNPQKKHVLSS